MLQLIVRMTTVALMMFCGTTFHHVPQQAHHGHPAVTTALPPAAPLSCDGAERTTITVDQAHLAHPCLPAALLQQPTSGDVDLPVVAAVPAAGDVLTAAAAAADAAHPPGRHRHTVLAQTSVYRS